MTTLIQINDKAFQEIITDAFREGARVARQELRRDDPVDDIISQDEALKMLGCGRNKLANIRAQRGVVFYTTSRPYSYSRKSVEAYRYVHSI